MILNFDMIEKFYSEFENRIQKTRLILDRPLTFSEKILYSHLFDSVTQSFNRGVDYVGFHPDRLAMQDATAQMALLQFIIADRKKTALPSTVHCDHLILAKDGADIDMKTAETTNSEVYEFLAGVSRKYGIGFWKPGAGIIHQVVLENYAFPGGMMIGTDSHTPNAGGLGMVAIGVGGADAVDAMVGQPWELQMPKIIGVKLTGKLNGWASAKDVILKLAGILTVKGGTGAIIEYFGDGAESISCTGKGTICNMGAEVGATTSLFSYDKKMEEYLKMTSREAVADLANDNIENLRSDAEVIDNPEQFYDEIHEIDLSTLEPYVNGPFTPDRAHKVSELGEAAKENDWPETIDVALIGSCTNSSYEDITRAASVARQAVEKQIQPKSTITITPGSEKIHRTIEKDGLLEVFNEINGVVLANACGPCIGQWQRNNQDPDRKNTIITSFNRNFSKRNDGNPKTHAFVASPEIVIAFALSGSLNYNPLTDSLTNIQGEKVFLEPPNGIELPLNGFASGDFGFIPPADKGKNVDINIDSESKRLQFLEKFNKWDGKDFTGLKLLIKTSGKCTTDHISMAGPWLKFRGHLENISNNFLIGGVNYYNETTNSIKSQISGEYKEVPDVCREYKDAGIGTIVVGCENFGEGSSREHAAMEARFMGVKAVLVQSFARIHETNLKKQGVLPLTFVDKDDYQKIQEDDTIDILGLTTMSPGNHLTIVLHHVDGNEDQFEVNQSCNDAQISWFKAGSALNLISSDPG